jgi:hypothetical protein
MTNDQIDDILKKRGFSTFMIRFKTRSPIKGLFIKTNDYAELSRKNLWRIVSEGHIAEYGRTNDDNLARIFNGVDFTRLENPQ